MTDVLVWDASVLHPFARADRVDVLADLARLHANVTTTVVVQELTRHGLADVVLSDGWLEAVPLDGLPELAAYATWATRLGVHGQHHDGEATVLAWAQVHEATALVDDGDARAKGQRAGQRVHGSLWLLARAVASRRATETSLTGLVRTVSEAGARYPADAVRDFGGWARDAGLLPARSP